MGGFDDNARFASVVMPHLDAAYNFGKPRLVRNRTDAEDVVQDASLRAFRAIRGFAGGERSRLGRRASCATPPIPGSARTVQQRS